MLLLLSITAAAQPSPWVEFDRRREGWADSPYEYDSSSLRRAGPRIRVIYRYKFFYSGRPDPQYYIGIEINCARWRARVYERRVYVADLMSRTRSAAGMPTIATPIAPGSMEASLAGRLCPAAGR